MKKLLIAAILVFAMAASAMAQGTTVRTSLSAAQPATGTQITVASASNITASTQAQMYFVYVDGEMEQVTAVSGTTLTVTRAMNDTQQAAHPSGAMVLFGPAGVGLFINNPPSVGTSCTAGNYRTLPLIDYQHRVLADCSNSRWTLWLMAGGSQDFARVAVTAAYTAKLTDYIIGYTALAAAYTVTLPDASGLMGKAYIIKNETTLATNTIWISDTIDGSTGTALVGANATKRIYSNGSHWLTW